MVSRMKSLKTFNLDHDVIQIVKKKQNQSQFVCKAVRKLHSSENEFDISDVSTRRLLVVLGLRKDCEPSIRALINHHLYEEGN